jgi:DNA repair protein RadC
MFLRVETWTAITFEGDKMNYMITKVKLPQIAEAHGAELITPELVAAACADFKDLAQETYHVLTINNKNKIINRHMVSLGTVDQCIVHPRETYRSAILDSASRIIVVHNHPSGDVKPSTEDIQITKRLADTGKIIGIELLDHVIIGSGFYSLKEHGQVTG